MLYSGLIKALETLLLWHTYSLKHCLNFSGKHPAICCNSSAKTVRKSINHSLLPGTHWYSWM